MLYRLGWVILWLLLWTGVSVAQNQPAKLIGPTRVIWVMEEEIDDVTQSALRAPTAWSRELKPLGFLDLDPADNQRLAKRCSLSELMQKKPCETMGSADADLLIAGRVLAETRATGPAGPGVGARLDIKLKVYRLDKGEFLFAIKQPSYGTGKNAPDAMINALTKVARPMAIRLSNLWNIHLRKAGEGHLIIEGLPSGSARDDLSSALRFVPGIVTVSAENQGHDPAELAIGYSGATWGTVVALLNRSQGSGIKPVITGNTEAKGRYDAALAFRLLAGVTALRDTTRDDLISAKATHIPEWLESDLSEIPYVIPVTFPVRLSSNTAVARRELRAQYKGELVFAPKLSMRKGQLLLSVEVWSTFAGRLFTVIQEADGTDLKKAVSDAVAQIRRELPAKLDRRKSKLPRLRRSQFKAWRAHSTP